VIDRQGEIREVADRSEAGNARRQNASAAPAQVNLVGVLEFGGRREEKRGKSVGSDSDGSECQPNFGEKERTC